MFRDNVPPALESDLSLFISHGDRPFPSVKIRARRSSSFCRNRLHERYRLALFLKSPKGGVSQSRHFYKAFFLRELDLFL